MAHGLSLLPYTPLRKISMSSPSPASSTTPSFDQLLLRPGQMLKDGRYEVHRKLGTGLYSTTWLVSDSRAEFMAAGYPNKYRAAKVLSIECSDAHRARLSRELQFLQQIAQDDDCDELARLEDHFEIDGPGGKHLCLVMHLYSTDVSSFRRSAPKQSLPVYTAKHIITAAVQALSQLHRLKIIHTDLKLDNILFNSVPSDQYVEEQLATEPLSVEGEVDVEGIKYPLLRSQPIPHMFQWDEPPIRSELIGYVVTDLGQGESVRFYLAAQRAGEQPTVDEFSAYALRAPEMLLLSDFSPKMDIWAVGCLTFELLVGHWLFAPEEGQTWTRDDDHLAKMMELTGETFSAKCLARANRRSEFFDKNNKLLRIDLIPGQSIEAALAAYKVLPEEEIAEAASFIRACLRLDSYDRPSARELEVHPWLLHSDCSYYR